MTYYALTLLCDLKILPLVNAQLVMCDIFWSCIILCITKLWYDRISPQKHAFIVSACPELSVYIAMGYRSTGVIYLYWERSIL